ncbi:hypothetical protein HF289_03200 [Acidithiobacillus ferrooxidans]|uniref:transposase n=1 Tax=Acidithiobacillus ferrooxidans TaxID=920 RepID=UPI001C06CB5E|nr:hypothetical protein [Acidithiobacillus ferrooxidans]
MDSLVLPEVSGRCMQIFLDAVARRYPGDNIVMMVDGAGWRKSNDLHLPENLRLLFLPPYSPELNPHPRDSTICRMICCRRLSRRCDESL